MPDEIENKKVSIIDTIKRDAKIYNSIVILIVSVVIFVNIRFLTSVLNYVPLLSIVTILTILLGLVIIGFFILKKISINALKKLMEYNNETNSLLVSKQQEINERKIAEEKLKKAHDELENSVKERTAGLSTTVEALKEQIAHRKKTEELLLQSKHDWEETFNTIPDIITIHDKNYNIIKANKAAEEILKLPDLEINEIIKCYEIYHGKDCPPKNCLSCKSLETSKPCTFEMFESHLNRYVEIRAVPQYDNNQFTKLIHLVRDITDQRLAEKKVQLQLKRLNLLRSIDKAIIGSIDLRIILNILVEQFSEYLNIDAAAVLILNQDTQMLEYIVGKGFRTDALKYTRLRLGESNAGRAALDRRIVTIPNLKENINGFVRSELFSKEDFITYFAVPLIAKGHVKGVLELFHRKPFNTDQEWMEFLEAIADQAAIAIDNSDLFNDLQRSNIELFLAYDTTIEGWSRAMDLRDKETEGHSQRVTEMTLRIAREIEMKEKELVHVRRGALLHDIGKMGIPDKILLKQGKLTEEEWKTMKLHPVYAYEMLYPIEYLRPAIDIPYCHHEKWDGTGYPRGLKGEEIPLSARIFAVVDVYDALGSDRPYRSAWSKEKILEHIRSLADSHFDPEMVEVFLKIEW